MLELLETTIVKLFSIRLACLLLPASWSRYGPLLQKLAERRNDPQLTQAIKSLEQRNSRLLQSPRNVSSAHHSPTGRIYRKLDSADHAHPIHINDLSDECMEIIPNAIQLIAVVLQWACSCYREGLHRTYLATRMLRRWSHLGVDVYDGVVSFLRDMTWVDTGELRVVFRIVAELVRSEAFAAGRYLQWLIATGSVGRDTDFSSVS